MTEKTLLYRISLKSLISAGIIAMAVALPQLVHFFAGATGGLRWLPMYLPVLLGGCLLGWRWGLGIGVLSPVISFLLTLASGNPMPALARLPLMIAELAVIAAVAGMFGKKIEKDVRFALPAALLALIAGRSVLMLASVIFQSVTPFTPAVIWAQIKDGLLGAALHIILVPLIVAAVRVRK